MSLPDDDILSFNVSSALDVENSAIFDVHDVLTAVLEELEPS